MKAQPDFDVGIIGGGPAGSSMAAYLAKAGVDCVVFEREIFPRPHVGESLVPSSTRVFNDLGFLPQMEENGFPHKYGAAWTSEVTGPPIRPRLGGAGARQPRRHPLQRTGAGRRRPDLHLSRRSGRVRQPVAPSRPRLGRARLPGRFGEGGRLLRTRRGADPIRPGPARCRDHGPDAGRRQRAAPSSATR